MDKELFMICIISGFTLLYMLGGWKWKWIRRDIAPIYASSFFMLAGFDIWKCLLYVIAQDITFRLPYGDKTPYWLKALVGISYVLPALIFGFTAWMLVVPVIFILAFFLSNVKKTSGMFSWKICEAITGFFIGVVLARLIGG